MTSLSRGKVAKVTCPMSGIEAAVGVPGKVIKTATVVMAIKYTLYRLQFLMYPQSP